MAAKSKTKKKTAAASKKAAAAKPAVKPDKPAADPQVAKLKKQIYAINAKLKSGALDLVTKVALQNEKRALERRVADLKGDKPFLAKVPKHKQAA